MIVLMYKTSFFSNITQDYVNTLSLHQKYHGIFIVTLP